MYKKVKIKKLENLENLKSTFQKIWEIDGWIFFVPMVGYFLILGELILD